MPMAVLASSAMKLEIHERENDSSDYVYDTIEHSQIPLSGLFLEMRYGTLGNQWGSQGG
jgi:hypothetical protein